MSNLSTSCKFIRHSNAVAAGTTDIEPANGVDTANAESVVFVVAFGTITATAVTTIKAQQSDAIDGSGDAFSDLTGTEVAVAATDDNKLAYLEIHRPIKRYVRCVVTRGTANAVLDGIVGILNECHSRPATHDSSTVLGGEFHQSPAEGTA